MDSDAHSDLSIPPLRMAGNHSDADPHPPCADVAPSEQSLNEAIAQRQMVLTFNFWTLGVVMPLIAIFGVLANTASIVVLTRKTMRSSPINVYLAGLSAFDGLLLLMTLLLYPALSYCEMEESTASPWCQYFFHSALVTFPISLIGQSGSAWTLTAITIDRFIAIMWPLQSRDWCTSRRASWVMAAIVLWSFVYNLPVFFELRLVVQPPPDFGAEEHVAASILTMDNMSEILAPASPSGHVELMQTDLRRDPNYVVAYKGYCYLIFMLLLPAGMMIILNIFVTLSVRKAYRLRKAMSGREEKERRCTIMAVLVVVTFLVLNSLAFVNNLIEIFATIPPVSPAPPPLDDPENISAITSQAIVCDQQHGTGTKSTAYLLLVSVGNVLVALNSATNFLIYCALGLRFRKMFCKIFCPRLCAGSVLAADIMTNERSYQSLTVRYSIHGIAGDKRNRANSNNGRAGSMSGSPVTARHSSQLLVNDALESVCISSGPNTPGSFNASPLASRSIKLKKGLGSFV